MYPDQPVVTGEAVALDIRLADLGSRGVAALIDYVIVTVAEILLLIAVIVASLFLGAGSDAIIALALVTVVGVTLGYPVLMETLWRGRTLGKAAMGLRVVRDDGGPIRFRHALIRGLLGVFLEKPGIFFTFPALISISMSSQHKRIGDLAAGTIVLQQRVPGGLGVDVTMPPPLAGWAASLDLSAVDDALALQIRQFLGRAHSLSPASRGSLEYQLATTVVSRVGPPPTGTPPATLLTAILAERRRRAVTQAPAPRLAPAPPPAPAVQPLSAQPPVAPAPESATGFVIPS